MVRYGKDKERLKEIMEENKEAYCKMDSDTRELLEVVAKVRVKEENQDMADTGKTYDLCKAFMDMKLEGIMEEKQEHLVQTVCIKLRKNKPAEVIADELEEELSAIEEVIAAQKLVGSYDVKQICKVLTR